MPKLPGVNHEQAVRALKKAGFEVVRHGKHIVMSDGVRVLTISCANPINAYTMGGIIPIAWSEFTNRVYSCLPYTQEDYLCADENS
jgi:predicted RNA binding protein YcfA (HicA-like mRNA interferase family)